MRTHDDDEARKEDCDFSDNMMSRFSLMNWNVSQIEEIYFLWEAKLSD